MNAYKYLNHLQRRKILPTSRYFRLSTIKGARIFFSSQSNIALKVFLKITSARQGQAGSRDIDMGCSLGGITRVSRNCDAAGVDLELTRPVGAHFLYYTEDTSANLPLYRNHLGRAEWLLGFVYYTANAVRERARTSLRYKLDITLLVSD